MPISANPITIPAKVLDKYWVETFTVGTTGLNGLALLNSSLLPYNDSGDIGPSIALDTINVFQEMATDPDAAQIFSLVMAYIEKKAKEQGKIQ